ncbi:hypothetical protein HK413_11550 [Mucilaginibacter sp. S1162]|uniref:DUF3300 domain-containing protein n=1 Tax=Mucilaginibacter humi TaxID=2732510 RepID=A0ABX1W6D5_9SPHI|nr:hypothetical protein [Mucilaginibacter humi]NNU34565.1 hypothetical protein [Mucilaginibacter humi]
MKKVALISAIALSGLFYSNANAQLLQIGLHLGGGRPVVEAALVTPSVAVSYSNADQYYYMPEVDAYYSPYERVYYYNEGGRWVSNAYLPGEYRNYDWRTARRYEVRAHRPYLNADVYREKYRGYARDWNRRDDRFDNRRDERFDNRNDRRDDRFDNRNDRRDDGPRFVRPNEYRGAEHADNRGWNNGNRRDDRNDHGQGNYNQQPQQNWPSQPSRNDNNGQQQGRGQGGYNQPSQQQPQNQPSRQNGGGQQRGNGNSGNRFAYNGQNGRGQRVLI